MTAHPAPPQDGERAFDGDAIAVVGIGCRYADARGPEEFWEICRSERNTVRDAPDHRIALGYDIDHFYDPRPRIPGKISSKKGGFLEHPELFDPAPFGIAPRDALTMEPQQRLMVEVTWDALEDAGIIPESIAGERVAVILGYMAEDYSRERTGVLGEAAVFRGHDVFTVGGMSHAVLSGRIAFLLGVTGPSFTLDTACSSSLIATHLACQSLRRRESNMAIAGGVNLFLSPEGNIALSRSGMLSMSGACKAFDASADGFVRAEGAGVVVLRRLADALEEGNPIYAVIRGSGISTDGRDGGHMMAPGRHGQAQAMRDAYAQAGVSPSEVQYVETHGTGTMIGDPVEIGALADVMGPGRSADRPLRVASVKGNLGHTESASGVAGLIKACLAIRHRVLPKQLHFETPNPVIPWDEIPVCVQSETTEWPYPGPALVGVNSFGISGTNAHVVLESPPAPPATGSASLRAAQRASHSESGAAADAAARPTAERRPFLLPITGHDPQALHDMAEQFREELAGLAAESEPTEAALTDLAYTLSRRRFHRTHRIAVVGRSAGELREALEAYLEGHGSTAIRSGVAPTGQTPGLVMVFPGQGGQWLGMGRDLLDREPAFAAAIDELDAAFGEHVSWSLRAVLEDRAELDWTRRLDVLQPLLVAVEIGLAALWASWGIRPTRVIGQSMGEIAAAHVAGILDLEDVARLACERGRIVAKVSGQGAMAVVAQSRDAVQARLSGGNGGVEVAGANAPTTTIISGDRGAVEALVADWEVEGVFARRLDVDFASHCFHMDPLLDEFREAIRDLRPQPAQIPFDSTVDGETPSDPSEPGAVLDTEYWVRNLRSAVAFESGLRASLAGGGTLLLEVSPHPTLPRAIDEIAKAQGATAHYVASLVRDEDAQRVLVESLGELFVRGASVDFDALVPEGRVVSTPLYAYQRKRYWFSERSRTDLFRPTHPLLGARSDSSFDERMHSWDFVLDADSAGFMQASGSGGRAQAPNGLYLELALAAAEATWPGRDVAIRDVVLERPLMLGRAGRRALQVVLQARGEGVGTLRVSSREDASGRWKCHATADFQPAETASPDESPRPVDLTLGETLPVESFSGALEGCGLAWSSAQRALRELRRASSEGETTARVPVIEAQLMLSRAIETEWHAYRAHPTLIENVLQLIGQLLEQPAAVRIDSIEAVRFVGGLGSDCLCRIRSRQGMDRATGPRQFDVDIELFDRDGGFLGALSGVRGTALATIDGGKVRSAGGTFEIGWLESDLLAAASAREVDRWIVVSDSADEAGMLAAELRKVGASCRFCEKVEDLAPMVERVQAESSTPWGLALLAWADDPQDIVEEPPMHRAYRVASWADAIRGHCLGAAQFWIATRGLQSPTSEVSRARGPGRNVAREIDTFTNGAEMQQCRLFDASPELLEAERVALAALMGRPGEDRQFVARGGLLRVPRLQRRALASALPSAGTPAGERDFRALHAGQDGLGTVVLTARGPASPEAVLLPSEVLVEVRAVGLGQLDVLEGLGRDRRMGRAERGLGDGFSGVVRQVADAHGPYSIGDAVVGFQPGALGRWQTVPIEALVGKPEALDFASSAGLVWPRVVACHALETVARLRAGDRVLLLGAGAVGQAMVRVAGGLGAAVTVVSEHPQRRALVEEMGAMAISREAFRSADPSCEENRFDVIVGAESGSARQDALERLAAGGCYLDLSPRVDDRVGEPGSIRLAANRSMHAIDVRAICGDQPALAARLLARAIDSMTGDAAMPAPVTRFPVEESSRALRFMTQNRHVGPVCIELPDPASVALQEAGPGARSDATSLAGRGAVVVSGEPGPQREETIAWLEARAADEVIVLDGDAGTDGPIGGWIHIASERGRRLDDMGDRVADRPLDFRVLISLRESVGVDPDRNRAWETRLWVDRLVWLGRAGSDPLWIVSAAEEGSVGLLTEALDSLLGEPDRPSPVVLIAEEEIVARAAQAPSPLLREIDFDGDSGGDGLVRSSFLDLSPPARTAEMRRFVCAELAQVLGLSEEQKSEIDLGGRLDGLGLDSLMTMEFFMGMGRSLELEIEASWFPTGPTLAEVAHVLSGRLEEDLGRTH